MSERMSASCPLMCSTTSPISIMCDCPYTGKTREIRESAEIGEKRRKKLRNEIKKTKENLVIAKTVLMDTHHKLAAFRRILSLELGWIINPHVEPHTSRKNRIIEQSHLKSKLIHLVDYLRECDPRYINDPDVHPTKLSASAEDLLSSNQERVLKDLYHGYTIYLAENEIKAGASLRSFLKLRENYENKLYCNKVMGQEIASIKKKISELQRQSLEDGHLIDYITSHHFKMKGTFILDTDEESVPGEVIQTEDAVNEEDKEAEFFKEKWKQSRKEKKKLSARIQALKERLEYADQKIIRAENFCMGNVVHLKLLADKVKENILLSKMKARKKNVFEKFSFIQYRSEQSQIEAAINENKFLRYFLRKAILSETNNLKHFENSLSSTAKMYHSILEDVRNKAIAEAAPPPTPEVVETKATKKKAK